MCIPASCSEASLITLAKAISEKLTAAAQSLIKKFDIQIYIVPPNVGLEVSLVKSKLAMEKRDFKEQSLSANTGLPVV